MSAAHPPAGPAHSRQAKGSPVGMRLLAAAAAAVLAGAAHAQGFPDKAITLVVPFAPGASADGISRIIGREMSAALGQPVIIDNRPGAGGATGLIGVARAAPDGYTIGLGATGAIAVNPHLPDAPPLKPEQELAPVAKLADIPLVLIAGAKSGYGSLAELLAKARATPDGIAYGTSGKYTSQHLSGELLADLAHVHLNAVPYRGSNPAVTDVLGGQVPLAVVDLTAAAPHIKSGAVVALGVTSAARSPVAPDIPTIAEGGVKGYAASGWMGLFAPAQTPAPVLARLTAAVQTAMAKPEVKAQIINLAAEPQYLAPAAFKAFVAQESRKWQGVLAAMPAAGK